MPKESDLRSDLATVFSNSWPRPASRHVISVIGGGTGSPMVIEGLMDYPEDVVFPISLCNMFDSGGDSGELKDKHGILPPGDMRRSLVAHHPRNGNDTWRTLFGHRYLQEGSKLYGNVLGNLIHLACEEEWDRPEAIRRLARDVLHIRGRVRPMSIMDADVEVTLDDGTIVFGEGKIDTRDPSDLRGIADTRLVSKNGLPILPYLPALEDLKHSDLVVFAPGDLYTSLIPNLMVEFVGTTLREVRHVVSLPNLMTKPAETRRYSAFEFVERPLHYSGELKRVGTVIVNTRPPPESLIRLYREKYSEPVLYNSEIKEKLTHVAGQVVECDLLDVRGFDQGLIRHDPNKVAAALMQLAA